MRLVFIFLILLIIKSVFCEKNGINLNSGVTKNDKSSNHLICGRSICIQKCCPLGHKVGADKSCNRTDDAIDYSKVEIYDKDVKYITDKTFEGSFGIVPGVFEMKPQFMEEAWVWPMLSSKFHNYLDENGFLWIEIPNLYKRWNKIDHKNFCVDLELTDNNIIPPKFWAVMESTEMPVSKLYIKIAMWVSCFFLLLVLIVYAFLPELRNLCGMILMAYVASLFWAFLLLAVIQTGTHDEYVCFGLTLMIYFSFIASFCWMNVMSYDIWWTFRGYAKARPIHRRGERFKFLMYCLYAFGVPLAMTIFMGVVNTVDMTHMPSFIIPNIPTLGCFLEGEVKFLYLYVPMLILIVCNWLFYLLTAYNVWRLGRGTAVLDNCTARGTPTAHRTQRHRLMLYLKLSIVMGLNWVFEVISFSWPDFKFWYISDMYNILIGFSIFLIFVCKRNIYRKLKKRYRTLKINGHPSTRSYSSSNSDSSSNQETMTLQISANPKGDNAKGF